MNHIQKHEITLKGLSSIKVDQGGLYFIALALLIIFFGGEPDIQAAIIFALMGK